MMNAINAGIDAYTTVDASFFADKKQSQWRFASGRRRPDGNVVPALLIQIYDGRGLQRLGHTEPP